MRNNPFTLSQYYPMNNNDDSRRIQCQQMIQQNHEIKKEDINTLREFGVESDSTLTGILCYNDRMDYYNDYGLVLCANDKGANTNESVHVSVENENQPSNHLLELDIKSGTSYIVTLQLWINYKGSGKWEGNELYLINIEESTRKFRLPFKNIVERECYGLKIVQDRIVYQIEDGMNLKRFFRDEFWFIAVSYFVSLWILRVINKIFKNKQTSGPNDELLNNGTKSQCQTANKGERDTTLGDPKQDG